MAEYVAIPARRLHKLPPDIDMAQAALIEPLAVGVHTMNLCRMRKGATAVVIGAGPIGSCLALCAREAGAGRVIISDVSDYRLGVARELGLEAVNARERDLGEVVREATGGRGAEFVFEATGIPAAAEGMTGLVAIAGTLVIVGIFPHPLPVDLRDVAFRELTILGIRMYRPEEFDQAVEMVGSGRIDVSPLITDIFPLQRGIEAFERTAEGGDNMKILIRAEA